MPRNKRKQFVLCVKNDDAEDLELRKLYEALPDRKASRDGYLRVIDESGEVRWPHSSRPRITNS